MKRVQKSWGVVVVCGAVFLGLSSLRSEARNSGASASAQRSGHQLSAPPSAGSGPAAARAPCAVPSPGRTGKAWPKAQRYVNVPQGTPMSRGRRICRRRRRGPPAQLPRFHADGSGGESRGPGRPPIRRQRPTPGTPRDVTHPALEVPPSGRAWEKPRRASGWGLSKGENNSLVNRARYSYPEKCTGR